MNSQLDLASAAFVRAPQALDLAAFADVSSNPGLALLLGSATALVAVALLRALSLR